MRVALVLIALILCGPNAAGAAPPAEGDLHGLWKVTSYHRQVVGTDEITVPMGAHPNGFLELRPDHHANADTSPYPCSLRRDIIGASRLEAH